jgi:hypothetical protein
VTTPPLPDADAWLVDDRWSKAYPLNDETHIGRGVGSRIILRDPVISRRHASVVKEGETYVLHSFGGAGTRVNGDMMETTHALCEGDKIEIAYTCLRFTMLAPTGEMFIMTRDIPTTIDQVEGPTRATMAARTIPSDPWYRRHTALLFLVAIIVVLLAFFAATESGAR